MVLADGGIGGGLVGFLVVLALVVAAVFLFRSMLKHMRRVPPTFEEDATTPADPEGPRTDADDG